MGIADLIAQEAMALPAQRQTEILDFIAFLTGMMERRSTLDHESSSLRA